jgi:tRNA pseudouridine38-40 synthase
MAIRTIKLILEYEGTNYLGWQIQARGPTLQGVIEEQLCRLTGESVRLSASGRTDAGVHALGQVAHFRTRSSLALSSFQNALNSLLPADIVVLKVEEVDEEFHARKGVKSKIYEYRILNRNLRSVFHRRDAWHIPQTLNLDTMKTASRFLVGEHDFSSFQSSGSSVKTTVRRIFCAEWRKGQGGLLRFEIEASGFLRQMVRAIVGTLVDVGRGKLSPEDFEKILLARDRKKAGPTAPARGLFLREVRY